MNKAIFTLYQYKHRDSGKLYIGITNNPDRRATAHANGRSGTKVFNRAVKKYGIEAFDYKVLAIFDDISAADYHEREAILNLGTLAPEGYNLRAGAPFTQYSGPASKEMRDAISAGLIGNKNGLGHHNNGLKGYKPTEETRAKRSASMKGMPKSDEMKHKLSIAHKGKIISHETRKRMSISHKDPSIETRAKMSARMKNNKFAVGKKSRLGKKHTAETRAKISATKKAASALKLAQTNK
jgi:group I intron endonuclease